MAEENICTLSCKKGSVKDSACLAVPSSVFWGSHSFVFQNTSGGLMEWLCCFKGITSLLCQNQLIICFTGPTRLTATLLTTPTKTEHMHISDEQPTPLQDADCLEI